ncbi:MAG: hypothetical protein VSS75_011405, partial [Candidatus Parabeggiatoa sp.]|nr:hypothetical protein [Candidatus Parabeggiatoa sp.]
ESSDYCRQYFPSLSVHDVEIPEVIELQEMNAMLRENMDLWYRTAEKKGEARGKANMFLYLLADKFGQVDEKIQAMIYGLDENSLLECGKRLLQGAQSVQDVLGPV